VVPIVFEEAPMQWNSQVRQVHRWLSITFTVTVVIVGAVAATANDEPAAWVYSLPLLPGALLLVSGLYLFVLPYAVKRRGGRLVADGR
jgi:uncharacterized membrane protein HdeD (DUF308 family)